MPKGNPKVKTTTIKIVFNSNNNDEVIVTKEEKFEEIEE